MSLWCVRHNHSLWCVWRGLTFKFEYTLFSQGEAQVSKENRRPKSQRSIMCKHTRKSSHIRLPKQAQQLLACCQEHIIPPHLTTYLIPYNLLDIATSPPSSITRAHEELQASCDASSLLEHVGCVLCAMRHSTKHASRACCQLSRRANLQHAALAQHHNPVTRHHSCQPVRNRQDCAVAEPLPNRLLWRQHESGGGRRVGRRRRQNLHSRWFGRSRVAS